MLKCDFCEEESESVVRVAIDENYDRLTERHVKKYACQECSAKKEAARKGQCDPK